MEFIIRPALPSDAPGFNALRRMPGVFENILGMPSEPLSRSEEYLAHPDRNAHRMVAVTRTPAGEELVIGTCGLTVSDHPRTRHTGSLGIMVHAGYQGMGVGNRLMASVLEIADNWLMLVRVELTVFCDNERAIALYQKHGFEIEGKKRMAAVRAGRYEDEYLMARIRPR